VVVLLVTGFLPRPPVGRLGFLSLLLLLSVALLFMSIALVRSAMKSQESNLAHRFGAAFATIFFFGLQAAICLFLSGFFIENYIMGTGDRNMRAYDRAIAD
jgi:hypothetical protein